MKKFFIFTVFLICIFLSSCGNGKLGPTDMEIAKYLSRIDGLSEIGTEDYDIPCDKRGISISPQNFIETVTAGIDDIYSDIKYYGVNITDLVSIKYENPEYFHPYYDHVEIEKDSTSRYNPYLDNSSKPFDYSYLLRWLNCSPEWTEWMKYNIPSYLTTEAHGLFHLYWFDPIDREYEKGIYLRELEDAVEIYAVFHEISLFYGTDHVAPYLLSEEMFEKMKTEFGDSFNTDGYAKGTISEFSNWFMGEYLKEVPSVFANIEEEVYYPRYGGSLNHKINGSDDAVAEMVSDLEKLGVNFDAITSCIIKVTVPVNGSYNDVFWELID